MNVSERHTAFCICISSGLFGRWRHWQKSRLLQFPLRSRRFDNSGRTQKYVQYGPGDSNLLEILLLIRALRLLVVRHLKRL